MRQSRVKGAIALLAMFALLLPATQVTAAEGQGSPPASGGDQFVDVGSDYNGGKLLPPAYDDTGSAPLTPKIV
ncbi:MAG TPA: hypothetical protein VFS18_05675, partial [Actinomycetota bacterium]|nr:hypothetical protein [Actinomycetota bacterium]